MARRARHKKHHHEEHENHERWLVSLRHDDAAVRGVRRALRDLLGERLQGQGAPAVAGGRLLRPGVQRRPGHDADRRHDAAEDRAAPEPPLPALPPGQILQSARADQDDARTPPRRAGAAKEEQDFQALKRRIDALVDEAGLGDKVSTTVSPARPRRSACSPTSCSSPRAARAINAGRAPDARQDRRHHRRGAEHPVEVEGHTDDQPIATSQYPSNWQLSGARAAAVVQRLTRAGVTPQRLSLARLRPRASRREQRHAAGRGTNRRVEIVLTRLHGATPSHGGDTHEEEDDHHRRRGPGGARRRLQVRPRQAGEPAPKPKVDGDGLRAPKEFLVNLADGRYAKLSVGLVLAPHDRRPSPPAATARRRRPRATARAAGGVVRDLITDELTDAADDDLIDARGPREAQGEDPQGDQEAHRRPGRGGPLHRRDGPVTNRANDTTTQSTTSPSRRRSGRGAGRRPPRPAAGSSTACTTSPSSWPWRSAARG